MKSTLDFDLSKEDMWQQAIDQAGHAVYITDEEGTIQYVNDAFTSITGYKRSEALGRNPRILKSDQQTQSYYEKLWSHIQQGKVWKEEVVNQKVDGSFYTARQTISPIQQEGDVTGYIAIQEDITEQKETEEALKQNQRRLKQTEQELRKQVDFLNTINQQLPGIVYQLRFDLDDEYSFSYISEGLETLIGVSAEQTEENFDQFLNTVHPEDRKRVFERIEQSRQHLEKWDQEYRHKLEDGTVKWVWSQADPEQREDGAVEWSGVVIDITQRKEAEQQRQETERRLRQITENINEVFWLLSDERKLLYVSPAFEDIYGISVNQLYEDPQSFYDYVHPDDRERVRNAMQNQMASGEYDEQYRIVRPDGEVRWIRDQVFPVTDDQGEVVRLAGLAQDITERVRLQQELEDRALHDRLTGLPNRSLFDDRLQMAIKRCERRKDWPFAVLFVDLDQFKEINDTYGHSFGDKLLQKIAPRLKNVLRSEDTVARFGGDEFTMLLEEVQGEEDVRQAVKRVQGIWDQPFQVLGRKVNVTASIGVVLATEQHHDPENLIQNADKAMMRAKQDSSSSVQFFLEELRVESKRDRTLKTNLSEAFEAEQFHPYYQPVIDLSDEEMVGLEALLRWRHPDQGLLLPEDFLTLAQESGLLPDIEFYVIKRVLTFIEDHYDWFQSGRLDWVSVNLSPQYFLQSEAVQQIVELIEDKGIDPSYLRVELTEDTAVEKDQVSKDSLREMNRNGLLLALDDYGTGYSSMNHLQMLPIDLLKIDRSLVTGSSDRDSQRKILKIAVQLTEVLDLKSIAEGIETQDQLELVKELGCQYAQGFLFDKALSPEIVRERMVNEE